MKRWKIGKNSLVEKEFDFYFIYNNFIYRYINYKV